MIVNISDEQSSLKINPAQVKKLVKKVIQLEGHSCDEVNIYFVDTSSICDLHLEFFNDDSPTDCISFPMDVEEDDFPIRILGEVFVCPETALQYAKENDQNTYEETTLYIVHGLLHLMGYDDIDDLDREKMREAEKRNMDSLREANLILNGSFAR